MKVPSAWAALSWSLRRWVGRRTALCGLALIAVVLAGCKASIGSGCNVSTDCSSQNDRTCDSAQPGGYCTILFCTDQSCPDNAVCVEFAAAVPGCPYSDYASPSRTGLAFCMAHCGSDSDCRAGYICRNPREAPWNAAILDDNQTLSVCIAAPSNTKAPSALLPDGSVCTMSLRPPVEAGAPAPSVDSGGAGTDAAAEVSDGGAVGEGAVDALAAD